MVQQTPGTGVSPLSARRIMVYGVTGSGKTTTAARLGGLTQIPWYAIDDLTWEAGWTPVPADEQRRRVARICAGDAWIIDHGYGGWLDIPLARADLVVALDFPRWVSFGWLLRRCLVNVLTRRPTCNGNVETWRTPLPPETPSWSGTCGRFAASAGGSVPGRANPADRR